MKKSVLGLIIALFLSFFALRPLFHAGFFSMHDNTQVGRVVSMGRALRLGQFPVRWVSDLGYGYGYPLYNFYGPLPYYAGGALYALGISGLMATKLMFAVAIFLAAGSMYLLASSAFGSLGGILASVLFTYAPYHAVQLYVRGAVGEFWAYAIVPLLLFGMYKQNNLVIALSTFGIVTSHTIMGYVVVLASVGALLLPSCTRRMTLIKGLIWGLGLSAFFWLPALTEKSHTGVAAVIGPTAAYADHFVCLNQLWDSSWGFAGSAPGCVDGMSFRLGKPHVILGLVGLLLVTKTTLARWAAMLGAVSLIMMLPVSLAVWRVIPNMAFIQYPWRFLMFAVLSLSILGGGAVLLLSHRFLRLFTAGILIGSVIMLYTKLFIPQTFLLASDASYETEEELRWRVSKVSDEYLPSDVPRPENPSEIIRDTIEKQPDVTMRFVRETDTYAMIRFDTQTEQTVKINKAYFPGWIYEVNSTRVEPAIIRGLPEITIPKGESTLEMQFTNTPVRTIGNTVSLGVLMFLLLKYGKTKKAHT